MIRKFRKKPVVIEARRFEANEIHEQFELADWCNGNLRGTMFSADLRVIQIHTLEGEMQARVGDWIIKGVNGEFYPCKPDIFDMTYEEVT